MLRRFLMILVLAAATAGGYYWYSRTPNSRIYKYLDADGQAHYVDTLDLVPEKFRESAKEQNLPTLGRGDYEKYLEAQQNSANERSRRK
jgi:hypothetical protein